ERRVARIGHGRDDALDAEGEGALLEEAAQARDLGAVGVRRRDVIRAEAIDRDHDHERSLRLGGGRRGEGPERAKDHEDQAEWRETAGCAWHAQEVGRLSRAARRAPDAAPRGTSLAHGWRGRWSPAG